MKVLVVNHIPEERAALTSQLAELGFEPLEAAAMQEAVATLQGTSDITAILLGWKLVRGSGLELLRWLRADARWQELPVVMVTGVEELGLVNQALDEGASEYLLKPHDAQLLLEKLLLLGVDPEIRKVA